MPRKLWNTQADWDAAYMIRIRDPSHPNHRQKFGYGRLAMARSKGPYDDNMTEFIDRVAKLTELFPIVATDRILIPGCGLGYIIEEFKNAGFLNCWGIDNSAHAAAKRGVEASGDTIFVEDDIRGGGRIKAALRRETGDDIFQWVISESVMESYEDNEMDQLLDAAEAVIDPAKSLTNIVHMVLAMPLVDPMFNQKTIAEWKAIRSTHSWVDYIRWVVG